MSIFSKIRVNKPHRNRFNLSHSVKTTTKFGQLMPFFCHPVVPGDTFKLNTEFLIRFAPFIAPVMHECQVFTHFFFVPNRLVWDNWENFITQGETGEEVPVYPRIAVHDAVGEQEPLARAGSLADYLGFPVNDTAPYKATGDYYVYDALPFRAYNLIYNEYYRDQNYMDEIDISKDVDGIVKSDDFDGRNAGQLLFVRDRVWKKDYFTSALPWPQRGPDVLLPLQGDASLVKLNGDQGDFIAPGGVGPNFASVEFSKISDTEGNLCVDPMPEYPNGDLEFNVNNFGVDMQNISSATINELRRAIAAQQFYEARARGGSRYIEQIFSLFGVKSSDARLQRPEYLGGGKSPVVISDVLQTSQTTETSAQATPSGTGVALGRSHSFKRYFEEHGYIIGIMSIIPKPAYQQGLNRLFTKFDPLDYYWPQFAHLGEQEIKQSEIFYQPVNVNNPLDPKNNENDSLFGYTPRYAEYKYIGDSVHGSFRNTLAFWHMGRIFNNAPKLGPGFLTDWSSANRPFAVVDDDNTANTDKIWCNIQLNCTAIRPMPRFGTPRVI